MKLGLLGYPLGHSFSADYFSRKFYAPEYSGWTYSNFERKDLDAFFRDEAPMLDGFNITIPYKRKVVSFLDELSEEASEIGAVNCIKRVGRRFIGYNTDAIGFRISLMELLDGFVPSYALILGTGGASRAISFVLRKMGIVHDFVSRTGELNYENVDENLKRAELIVNGTPLGMYPKVEEKPTLNYNLLNKKCHLYDAIYNPEITAFMEEGIQMGCKVTSGLRMLHLQADKSLEIWTSLK